MKKVLNILVLINCFYFGKGQTYSCNELPKEIELEKRLGIRPAKVGYIYQYQNGCNVSDSLKRRILNLLRWQWSQSEIDSFKSRSLQEREKYKFHKFEEIANYYAKGNDSIYKIILDSIRSKYIEDVFSSKKKELFKVNAGIMQLAASLNLKSAIPILNNALKDREHYDSAGLELALAKFGNKALQEKIIKSCSYENNVNFESDYFNLVRPKLYYLATQESICKINEWLDTGRVVYQERRKLRPKLAYEIMYELKHIIRNEDFQEATKNFPDGAGVDNPLVYSAEPILYCKRWLLKNRGKYKIDQQYCMYRIRRDY